MTYKACIIGGGGYTAGELIRLLLYHPQVELQAVVSDSQAGKKLSDTHRDLVGMTELTFTDQVPTGLDVYFLCRGHGKSQDWVENHPLREDQLLIDLSNDYRKESPDQPFVYGLPEWQKARIKKSSRIANPGCFATCIQLGLLPLAHAQQLNSAIHVSAITGSTGAGQALKPTTHFTWRESNISSYKVMQHQHLSELYQSTRALQPKWENNIFFVPYRGNFTRGILATVYTPFGGSLKEAQALYRDYYADHPFTHLQKEPVDLKQVVNTNRALLHLSKEEGQLIITSCIDNLLKGASGQAVQNMNLCLGLEESAGLQLKPSAF